ncbi:polyprenyl synthetase family protein [Ectobacillus antri]|jgi:geranylgeranyl diphosphate synthase type II|uniref:Polyprenyl synthetase family protein n=1 Tax=Ectobacillus antri TaxID=2486280 RepID=A0ABT6H3Q6_9BACI|nr:farnesyl diphosphate synthase [Ectobacillus antri]MDG4655606.1 polyprenyl synthetase family protein [Ectobacillus antri]MDG5753364.1 polyprenyl synthetase family protein [Ectobacillus antri]
MMNFTTFAKENKQFIEHELIAFVERLESPSILKESMLYSLQAGGKRVRPLLLFATLEAFGKPKELGMATACALEMIHTYSLIHDDLPCMDDDDLRRGKPTNHKVFGEAIATLAGDALLTMAFEVIARYSHSDVTPEIRLRIISELANAAGPEGMVAGQVADMQGEGQSLSVVDLEYIHRRKTGRLLEFAVLAGAVLAGANEEQVDKLLVFAANLGLAFQIRDDILDVEGTEAEIGKPVGSDIGNGKSTYTELLSIEGAKIALYETAEKARNAIDDLELNTVYLHALCDLVVNRNN